MQIPLRKPLHSPCKVEGSWEKTPCFGQCDIWHHSMDEGPEESLDKIGTAPGPQRNFIKVLQNPAMETALTAVLWNAFPPLIHHPGPVHADLTLWLGSPVVLHASQRWFPLPFWSRNCHSGHVPCTTNAIQECRKILTHFWWFFFPLSEK